MCNLLAIFALALIGPNKTKTNRIMDEDELIYREMNEEDPWYMGPPPTQADDCYPDQDDAVADDDGWG